MPSVQTFNRNIGFVYFLFIPFVAFGIIYVSTLVQLGDIHVMLQVLVGMQNEFVYDAALIVLNIQPPSPKLASLFLGFQENGVQIDKVFWCLWLFFFGFAVYKSTFLSKIIGRSSKT